MHQDHFACQPILLAQPHDQARGRFAPIRFGQSGLQLFQFGHRGLKPLLDVRQCAGQLLALGAEGLPLPLRHGLFALSGHALHPGQVLLDAGKPLLELLT